MHLRRRRSALATTGLLIALASAAIAEQPASHAGIAVVAQPQVYGGACASCHGVDLQGGAGPALKGATFVAKWDGQTTKSLYSGIADLMPLGKPGTLTSEQAEAITGYLLAQNGLKNSADGRILKADGSPPPASAKAAVAYPTEPAMVVAASTSTPTQAELLSPRDGDWPMYNRDYQGRRFSRLALITADNAGSLTARCVFQTGEVGSFQSSPLAYQGRLYVTTPYSTYAIDGATCRKLWVHTHVATGAEGLTNNRGAALYEGKLIRGTPDGHLIALDSATGALLWDTQVVDSGGRYALSAAITAFDGKVFTGLAGGDRGGTGRIFGFDAATGRHLWTFSPIPGTGEPGADTWGGAQHLGGGGSWTTISVDPKERLLLVPIGNPGSDLDGRGRPGANLYTNSIVALGADDGKLAWYVQQIPHDVHDWNTAAAPTLYELDGHRYLAVATKGGWLYTYDYATRALLSKMEISTHLNDMIEPTDTGVRICPGTLGGAEWNGAAFDPDSRLIMVNSVEWCATFKRQNADQPNTFGGSITFDPEDKAKGWLRAFDAGTGKPRWIYEATSPMLAGVTPTAGGVTFTGSTDGDFVVLASRSGKTLYRFFTGGSIGGGVSTYEAAGQQYVAVASGNASRTIWRTKGAATIFVFGLPVSQTKPGRPTAKLRCRDADGAPAECGTVYAAPERK